jgi:hypothetical protein
MAETGLAGVPGIGQIVSRPGAAAARALLDALV